MEEVIKVDDCVGNIGDYDIPIHNAIIVPENVTNGDVIKAMFPDAEIKEIMGSFDKDKLLGYRTWLGGRSQDYFLDWWNEPYNSENKIKLPEQQSSDNCISRQTAIDATWFEPSYTDPLNVLTEVRDRLKALPSAQPTPKQKMGKWVKHDTGHSIYYDCSLCGCAAPCTETADKILWKLSNYCPDCGAEMKESEE